MRRFFAYLIDTQIIAGLIAPLLYLGYKESYTLVFVSLLLGILTPFYLSYSQKLYSASIGKYLLGLRIISNSPEASQSRHIWLRYLLDYIFALAGGIFFTVTLLSISEADFYASTPIQRVFLPFRGLTVNTFYIGMVALVINLIIMFCHKNRYSLRDLLGATRVIKLSSPRQTISKWKSFFVLLLGSLINTIGGKYLESHTPLLPYLGLLVTVGTYALLVTHYCRHMARNRV